MSLITNFSNKKVVEYLNSGLYKRVLLIMHHGLGDAMMFYNTCYKALCHAYPYIQFFYDTHLGQQEVFGYVDKNPEHYDIAFKFQFHCSEFDNSDETKAEKCNRREIGLNNVKQFPSLPKKFNSPLVGLHFNSTCLSNMNVPQHFAKQLWEQILENDLIPIDLHMRHCNDNSRSIVYQFEQCRKIDNIKANTPKLMGMLSSCCGFAGVPSGNVASALNILEPKKILYITSSFPAKKLTRLPVHEINWKNGYDKGIIQNWIDCLK